MPEGVGDSVSDVGRTSYTHGTASCRRASARQPGHELAGLPVIRDKPDLPRWRSLQKPFQAHVQVVQS